jgi:PAS domain S-box-containing protein
MNSPSAFQAPIQQVLAQMRAQFIAQLGPRIAAIDSEAGCLVRGPWSGEAAQRLQLLAHNLAGSAGTFGAHSLSQAARRLEQSLSPYLETPPLEKEARIVLHRNVMEVIYMAQDAQKERRTLEAQSWHSGNSNQPLIYVIEDDQPLANAIAEFLHNAGYQTRIFQDPDAFLMGTKSSAAPQVVVMDMMFPQGNHAGARALAEFRAAHRQDIPAVMISARGDVQARLTALRSGATRYLLKPLNLERLVRVLDDLTDCRVHDPYCVLLVDDDPDVLAASAAILRSAGMRALEIANPLQALGVAQEFNPDVIVLDVHMPEISGIELAALLREDDDFAHIPILFLSSETDIRQQLLALDLGGDEFLKKPIDPSHLVAAVRTRAKRSRQTQIVSHNLRRILHEKEYQQFALNQHAIVSVANARGVITQVNEKFCAVSGYGAEELIGKNHRIVKSDRHAPDFYVEMWNTISSGQVWHGVVCNRRKDGKLYWVDSTIVPFLDDNGLPYQYVSIRTDVTEILHAESALRAERHLTAAAINALPGIFYLISAENRFLRFNQNLMEISGYSAQEIDAMSPLDFFQAQDHARIAGAIQDTFQIGQAFVEADLVTKSRARIPFYFQGAKVEIEGQPCLIGTGTDISELKQYQAALIAAKEAAESASQAKSTFLSSMSHELRTPMNAIIGFAQLAETDDTLSLDQRDNIEEILKAGQHLLELINQVLDLAKIESGGLNLRIEAVPCTTLFKECLSLMQAIADQRGIHLSGQTKAYLAVRADRMRLKQALINLLSNAVKYNHAQGEVRLEAKPVSDSRLRLSVADTGPGIPAAQLAKLFQPFQRLGAEHSPVEGTGIGLSISKHLIEAMGGSIGVESTSGVGSAFWIELPFERCTPEAQNEASVFRGAQQALDTQHSVLYIEDNPVNIKLVANVLGRRPQLKLLSAHDAILGLDMAAAQHPQLILLDINLPGLDGYAALAQLQAQDWGRNIPVVALSANALPDDIARGKAAGFADYLTKPLDVHLFLDTIDRLLDSTEARRAKSS